MQCPQCHRLVTREMASCPHCSYPLLKTPIARAPSQPIPKPHLDELLGGAMPQKDEHDEGAQGAVPLVVPLPATPAPPPPVSRLFRAGAHSAALKIGGVAASLALASSVLVGLMVAHNAAPPLLTNQPAHHQLVATVTGTAQSATTTPGGTPGLTPTGPAGTGTPSTTMTPGASATPGGTVTGTPYLSPTPMISPTSIISPTPNVSPCASSFGSSTCIGP